MSDTVFAAPPWLAEIVDDHMYLETISRTGAFVDAAVITRREAVESSSSSG